MVFGFTSFKNDFKEVTKKKSSLIFLSVIYEEQSLCVNWVAMLARSTPIFVFLFFIPIVLVYIILYLHDPKDPKGTSDIIYGTIGLEMLVLFIIIVVGVIRREQASKIYFSMKFR